MTENLVNKELKRLLLHSSRIFTINSSVVFMVKMAKLLNIKVSKHFLEINSNTLKISPIHQFINNSIQTN